MARRKIQLGRVLSFDDSAGLGTVVSEQGSSFEFHCTEIADGTRSILAGTAVTFLLKQGTLGRLQAVQLLPQVVNSAAS